jgi:hypothetical protein
MEVNQKPGSGNYPMKDASARCGPLVMGSAMRQQNENLRDGRFDGAIRTKLGEALRQHYDLMEPMPQGILELVRELDTRGHTATRERLFAEVERCLAAMDCVRPGNPEET